MQIGIMRNNNNFFSFLFIKSFCVICCFQVGISKFSIRFQISTFSPLIPGIDENQLFFFRKIFFCIFVNFFEPCFIFMWSRVYKRGTFPRFSCFIVPTWKKRFKLFIFRLFQRKTIVNSIIIIKYHTIIILIIECLLIILNRYRKGVRRKFNCCIKTYLFRIGMFKRMR